MSTLKFIKNGNIFNTKCEAIICPVNCDGVMGAGLAKSFRDKVDPDLNAIYKETCQKGLMSPGSVLVVQPCLSLNPEYQKKWITNKTCIYLATKMDWRHDSQLEWVEHGLLNLIRAMHFYTLPSVALPALGSGNGHLPWPSVEIMIKTIFENDGQTRLVEVYEPHQC